MLFAVFLDEFGHCGRDIRSGCDRGLDVENQDGVVAGIGEQHFERSRVAGRVGIAHDVDGICTRPGRRQHGVEVLPRVRRHRSRNSAELDQPVDGENTDAASVRQNGKPLSAWRFDAPERLRTIEELA